jgi:hypothetical protein
MLGFGVVLGVLLGTTAGPIIGGLALATWLNIGESVAPLAGKAFILCAHNSRCIRRSVPSDFSPYNHLGMGM